MNGQDTAQPVLLSVPADNVFVIVRGIATIIKDHAATRPYGVDLTDWLTELGDTLASASVLLEGIDGVETDTSGLPVADTSGFVTTTTPEVVLFGDTNGNQKAAAWLTGGVEPASATFTFATTGGAVDSRRIRFLIRER